MGNLPFLKARTGSTKLPRALTSKKYSQSLQEQQIAQVVRIRGGGFLFKCFVKKGKEQGRQRFPLEEDVAEGAALKETTMIQ
jgi:hypothetical protein